MMKIGRCKYEGNEFVFLVENDSKNAMILQETSINKVLQLKNPKESTVISELPFENLDLLPPTQPSKIVCVGRNYIDHAKELGNPIPDEPLIFLKPPSSIIGPNDEILYPPYTNNLHYEGEVALVLRKKVRLQSKEELMNTPDLFAITCFNDVTARDLQRSDKTWLRGKGMDTFAPIGPVLYLNEENKTNFEIETRVNSEIRQSSNTKHMKFQFYDILEYISKYMTLEVGDVVATGTPAGVGELHIDDVVEVIIPEVGILRNRVKELKI